MLQSARDLNTGQTKDMFKHIRFSDSSEKKAGERVAFLAFIMESLWTRDGEAAEGELGLKKHQSKWQWWEVLEKKKV